MVRYVPDLSKWAIYRRNIETSVDLMVTHLHEESKDEGLADIDVIAFGGKVCADHFQAQTLHDPGQL